MLTTSTSLSAKLCMRDAETDLKLIRLILTLHFEVCKGGGQVQVRGGGPQAQAWSRGSQGCGRVWVHCAWEAQRAAHRSLTLRRASIES